MEDNERGARIREAREARVMTQAHLAAAAGISVRTTMRLEAGSGASPETLRAVASVLGIGVEALTTKPRPPESNATELKEAAQARSAAAPRHRVPDAVAAALLACALTFAFCVGHRISWAMVMDAEASSIPDLTVVNERVHARNMARAIRQAGSSLVAGSPASGAWASEPAATRTAFVPVCSLPTLADLVTHGRGIGQAWPPDGTCARHETGLAVGKAGPGGMAFVAGPLGPEALADLVAMLPRHPSLTVRAAFGPSSLPDTDAARWFEPSGTMASQAPHPGSYSHVHVVLTPKAGPSR